MGRRAGVKHTGERAAYRRHQSLQRDRQKDAIFNGKFIPPIPKPPIPAVFERIHEEYWHCLKSVEDPRSKGQVVYPLDEILHRVICGFLSFNHSVGILFPKVHPPESKLSSSAHSLGLLPTRGAVYYLLKKIDWNQANVVMSPLWKCLGYTPCLIAKRSSRDPKEIIGEFLQEKTEEDLYQRTVKKQKLSETTIGVELMPTQEQTLMNHEGLVPLKK